MAEPKTLSAAGQPRPLNVLGDSPDIRDRYYQPALIRLEQTLVKDLKADLVLDQKSEGACTGFGLAAVINRLRYRDGKQTFKASARMLYEMAKRHDEWPGEDYAGSSCRGAIRGWHNMGVCSEKLWPYRAKDNLGDLTIERAYDARHNTLGAYYRLRPEVTDYHAALNETGAIYVSAQVHAGWSSPRASRTQSLPTINPSPDMTGGHAFAIVGYQEDGFIVQNSWGSRWGQKGYALWTYEDWIENVMDGWVFRLALPTPRIFGRTPRSASRAKEVEESMLSPVKRFKIAGHFVHFDDGRYKTKGNYWSTSADVKQTAELIAGPKNEKFGQLLIYAHGGLNSPRASARRVNALKQGFIRNGIYPYHIMYDTGLVEELGDVIKRARGSAEERAAGFTDWWDGLIEDAVRKPVTPIWEEMKRDARLPFEIKKDGDPGDGTDAINAFAKALAQSGKSIHLAGHSTGGVLIGHLLKALDALEVPDLVKSCSLMAPACTIEFYNEHYEPRLGKGGGNGTVVRLPKLTIYNLTDEQELDDNVVFAYRKSLLYLVSRALERDKEKPLLGMQRYARKLKKRPGLEFVISKGREEKKKASARCASETHGGFDNDAPTMNDILRKIIGKKPDNPFTEEDMKGY